MGDRFPEFMHADLTKLTWSGWLLLLATLGVFAVTALGFGLLLALVFGFPFGPLHRWVVILIVLVALGAAGSCFQLGKYLLAQAGFPILRAD